MSTKVLDYFNGDVIEVINRPYSTNPQDIIGQRFGKLIVVEFKGLVKRGKSKPTTKRIYEVVCDCGNRKIVTRDNLTGGTSKSCGCSRVEALIERQAKERLPDGLSLWKLLFNRHNKNNAYLRYIDTELTFEQFKYICSQSCYYCGIKPKERVFRNVFGFIYANGIDRVDSKLGYTLANSRPCCEYCNRMKLDKTEEDFLNQVKAIYEKHLLISKN